MAANGPEAHVAWLEADRGTAIEDRATLAAFMDEEAAAFARGAVDDYTRARVQHDPDELFAQPAFAAMLATARAEAYPVALTMIAETIEAALASQAEDRAAQRHGLMWVVLKAFDRRPRPDAVSAPAWDAARAELLRWIGTGMLRLPKTTDAVARLVRRSVAGADAGERPARPRRLRAAARRHARRPRRDRRAVRDVRKRTIARPGACRNVMSARKESKRVLKRYDVMTGE
jgi:hypothetical protein